MDGAFHVTRPDGLVDGMTTSVGVVSVSGTPQKPVARVPGVATREAAEALRGTPILAAVALDEGEWWAEDLVGLRVVDGDVEVGVVSRVRAYPSCELLEVGDLLIPMIDDAVGEVDLEAGVVHVDLGFLGAR